MLVANANDKPLVVGMLTAAFLDNKSVNYLVGQEGLKLFRIHELMDYSFEMCMLFGSVFLSEDRRGCALVMYPELKRTTLRSVWLDLKLIAKGIGFGNLVKALQREGRVRAKQPDVPMAYLWFIGVDPAHQGSGIGSRLMRELTGKYDSENRPVFLETSTLRNLPWYEKFGFKVYDHLDLSYRLYFLNRKVQ